MTAFPKSARLRQSAEFGQTLNEGVKAVSSQIVLFARPRSAAENGARLGLIVSRKVGESAARNRVKRHLREAFRHLKPDIDREVELQDLDLVVIARANAAAATSAEIAGSLRHCLKRLSRMLREKDEREKREAAPQGTGQDSDG